MRDNVVDDADMDLLNSRLGTVPVGGDFSISLTATNRRADAINAEHLNALKGRFYVFDRRDSRRFRARIFSCRARTGV